MKYYLQYKSATHVYIKDFESAIGRELFKQMIATYGNMVVCREWNEHELIETLPTNKMN